MLLAINSILISQCFVCSVTILVRRVNLVFPILYVLATIVICGLPMIITPVETAIGLAMILSGFNIITTTSLKKAVISNIPGINMKYLPIIPVIQVM